MQMRNTVKIVVLFAVLAIVFSAMGGCRETPAPNSNSKPAASATAANGAAATGTKASDFPMLATGIADAEIELLDGSKTKLSDHKGKILIANLWGIWCGPCREEMPHLAQMQRQYADKGLEVISLNIGDHDNNPEPIENIKKFAEQMKIDYTLARLPVTGTQQFYMLTKQSVVPQTIMVDREGRLRGVFVGGGQRIFNSMQETLDKLMAE
ncbi:hypothetical protein BH10ACI3_BH10ACI3_13140 [soil metagenome]